MTLQSLDAHFCLLLGKLDILDNLLVLLEAFHNEVILLEKLKILLSAQALPPHEL